MNLKTTRELLRFVFPDALLNYYRHYTLSVSLNFRYERCREVDGVTYREQFTISLEKEQEWILVPEKLEMIHDGHTYKAITTEHQNH